MEAIWLYRQDEPYREKAFSWEDVTSDFPSIELAASLLFELAFEKGKVVRP